MSPEFISCPICKSQATRYQFWIEEHCFRRCQECEMLFVHPFPKNTELNLNSTGVFDILISEKEKAIIDSQLSYYLDLYGATDVEHMMIMSSLSSALSNRLIERGHQSMDQSTVRELKNENFDCVSIFNKLGDESNPTAQLLYVSSMLRDRGVLMLTIPTIDNARARQKSKNLQDLTGPRATYMDRHCLSALLVRCGFIDIRFWFKSNSLIVLCRKDQKTIDNKVQLISIILPVFNEAQTCEKLIDTVLRKELNGVNREIIIVESNSTDGTRDIVKKFESVDEIRIIYEEEALGKGHAVRNGINHADGDIFLIQDADLEYDIEDYDELLKPVISKTKLFVLGSRHKGNWKMREFTDRRWLGAVFNFGQIFFTFLINVVCKTKLKDPFTMYKIFHRECLSGIELRSNRFDLDWEIVIKFIRKGLIPVEVPVNYISRSFSEGKKVRPIRDPIMWLYALLRFRFGRLYENQKDREIE